MPPDLLAVLRERFGFEAFRPGQERLVRDALAGRDALAVLPTGSGKSLVYQLAAQLLPNLTVVVSPLLALMRDQVESLAERGLDVQAVNSLQTRHETEASLEDVRAGRGTLLYVTPERLEDEAFVADLRRVGVSLLVIDEAHSVSEWGHSFRPAYLRLAAAARALGRPTLLALTATATPWVRREIVERLGLRDPDVVVHGVDRPNLFLEVVRVEDESEDRRVLERLLVERAEEFDGSGIVYCATTRATQETAAWLNGWGIPADFYHGQRKKADRERVQSAFMAGDLRVIAATNAFGMGVDKPDARFVIHRDVPASLEAYWQEAGRAGRDGEPARCCLIYRVGDLGRAAFLGGGGELTRDEVRRARPGLVALQAGTHRQMQQASGLGQADFLRLVDVLKREGLLAEQRRKLRLLAPDFDPEAVPLDREAARRAYERSRLDMMRGYAETPECRRAYLLSYFGEEYPRERCSCCDNDARYAERAGSSAGRPAQPEAAAAFAVHERVRHPHLGDGVVQRVSGDTVTVLFDTAGYRTLDAAMAVDEGLLTRAS